MHGTNMEIIFRKSIIFTVQKQPIFNRKLGKTKLKQREITCLFELDVGTGTAESAVDSESTLCR